MSPARGATDGWYHPSGSPLHRLAPHVKIVAAIAYVLAVVATPRAAGWAFACDALLVLGVARAARLPVRLVVRRMRVDAPFLLFAVFLPVVGTAPRVAVLGLPLSEPGLWAAWNIVVKGTLGVLAGILLTATTPVPELVRGLERLRVPRVLTAIAMFMVRYVDVVAGEAARMRVARESRGHDPRWVWQARAVASSAGALFVRSFERGERVYVAMCSRGYTGTMPPLQPASPASRGWARASSVPAVAVVAMVLVRVAR